MSGRGRLLDAVQLAKTFGKDGLKTPQVSVLPSSTSGKGDLSLAGRNQGERRFMVSLIWSGGDEEAQLGEMRRGVADHRCSAAHGSHARRLHGDRRASPSRDWLQAAAQLLVHTLVLFTASVGALLRLATRYSAFTLVREVQTGMVVLCSRLCNALTWCLKWLGVEECLHFLNAGKPKQELLCCVPAMPCSYLVFEMAGCGRVYSFLKCSRYLLCLVM